MSVQAISWALDDAPGVPQHLVSTLIALANHADHRGRGAYPSIETLTTYTRKVPRQVQRDIRELVALGLIRPGDQSNVAKFRADRRPRVWDLATERKSARDDTHDAPPDVQRDDTHDTSHTADGVTPASCREPRGDADDVTSVTERGDTHVADGVTPVSPKPSKEPTSNPNNPPTPRPRSARTGDPDRFAEFYDAYPRHVARGQAVKAWRAAVNAGADPDVLINAAHCHAGDPNRDPRFTKHPATWLNGQCWLDEPEPTKLRAVSGEHQSFRNPTDQSVYDEPLLPPNRSQTKESQQ